MAQLVEVPIVDWKACPLVEVNPRKLSGTPILKGTRMPADAILQNFASGSTAREIAETFEIPEEPVRALLSYAIKHHSASRR